MTSPAPKLEEVGWDQEANGFVGLNWRSELQEPCWRMLLLPRIMFLCSCNNEFLSEIKIQLIFWWGGKSSSKHCYSKGEMLAKINRPWRETSSRTWAGGDFSSGRLLCQGSLNFLNVALSLLLFTAQPGAIAIACLSCWSSHGVRKSQS